MKASENKGHMSPAMSCGAPKATAFSSPTTPLDGNNFAQAGKLKPKGGAKGTAVKDSGMPAGDSKLAKKGTSGTFLGKNNR